MLRQSSNTFRVFAFAILAFGTWLYFRGRDYTPRPEVDPVQVAVLAGMSKDERPIEALKQIFRGKPAKVEAAGSELRISIALERIWSDRDIAVHMGVAVADIITGVRKRGVDIAGRAVTIALLVNTIDKFGNPSGQSIATRASWRGEDLMRVTDQNALVYGIDLAKSVFVAPLARKGMIEYCAESGWTSPPENFCRLALVRDVR